VLNTTDLDITLTAEVDPCGYVTFGEESAVETTGEVAIAELSHLEACHAIESIIDAIHFDALEDYGESAELIHADVSLAWAAAWYRDIDVHPCYGVTHDAAISRRMVA